MLRRLRAYGHIAEGAVKYFAIGKRNGEITCEPAAGIGGDIQRAAYAISVEAKRINIVKLVSSAAGKAIGSGSQ